MDVAGVFVLAGLVVGRLWTPPAGLRGSVLPATVMTVSECLTDVAKPDQEAYVAPWHGDLRAAIDAAARASAEVDGVRVMAVHVSVADRDAVVALINDWIGGAPDPIRDNLAAMAQPLGQPRGFEVVGLEAGRTHSWLCYGLHEQAIAVGHNLRRTPLGLLTSPEQARAVAAMANADRDTANGTSLDVTWLPVLVTECQS